MELVFSWRVEGDCERPVGRRGPGEPDAFEPRRNEPRRTSSEAAKTLAIAPLAFLPPCVTRFGKAFLSLLGSGSNWYADSGSNLEAMIGRTVGGGGELEPALAEGTEGLTDGGGGSGVEHATYGLML